MSCEFKEHLKYFVRSGAFFLNTTLSISYILSSIPKTYNLFIILDFFSMRRTPIQIFEIIINSIFFYTYIITYILHLVRPNCASHSANLKIRWCTDFFFSHPLLLAFLTILYLILYCKIAQNSHLVCTSRNWLERFKM